MLLKEEIDSYFYTCVEQSYNSIITFSLSRPVGLSFEIILPFINPIVNRVEVIKYRWSAFYIARKAALISSTKCGTVRFNIQPASEKAHFR